MYGNEQPNKKKMLLQICRQNIQKYDKKYKDIHLDNIPQEETQKYNYDKKIAEFLIQNLKL